MTVMAWKLCIASGVTARDFIFPKILNPSKNRKNSKIESCSNWQSIQLKLPLF